MRIALDLCLVDIERKRFGWDSWLHDHHKRRMTERRRGQRSGKCLPHRTIARSKQYIDMGKVDPCTLKTLTNEQILVHEYAPVSVWIGHPTHGGGSWRTWCDKCFPGRKRGFLNRY